jgi:aliphatic nitrilase
VQAAPAFLDLDAGVEKSIALIADAAGNGAQLIGFPETFLPGYPWFVWLGAPAWGLQFFPRYHDNSLVYGSPQAERLAAAARRHGITVVMGLSERQAGSLYIAQWIIGPDGETIAKRRKLKPTHVERTVFGEGSGADLAVHATALGNLGGLNCWEHLQPLTKYAMYAQNEQVHVAAWPSFSLYRGGAYALGCEANNAASQVYALEGGCFVLAPCGVVSPAMVELLCTDDTKRALLQPGGGYARIYGPDGRPLAEPLPETAEGLLYADIDLGLIALAKAAADPAGHYARPDVTRLLFNKAGGERVVSFAQAAELVSAGVEASAEVVPLASAADKKAA